MNYKAFKSPKKKDVNHQPFDIFEPYKNDDSIGEKILQAFLRNNPHIVCGDRMPGPVMLVKSDGNIPTKEEIDADVINSLTSDYKIPDWEAISCNSCKVYLPFDGEVIQLPQDKKYIHYYACQVFTYTAKIGDLVRVVDSNTSIEHEVEVTEEMIKRGNFALFRYGLS